ncbi:MAG: hypothetical protein AAGC46_16050 [Solirubrobacteraceae bacterium]|nr:hypothetical protein [Patulibacter sp.]
MDRQTARNARALVTPERSVASRTGSVVARTVGLLLLIAVICLTIVIATGKA